jgi:hypothetical protein
MKRTVLSAAVLVALSAGAAQASTGSGVCTWTGPGGVGTGSWCTTTGNNFTMIGGTGTTTGGTNDVTFSWNTLNPYRTAVVTDGSYNATLSSPTPFFGKVWTAHNVNVYGPGTYVFDTTSTVAGNPSVGTGTASQKYTLTVPTGYVGAHMLFDWSTSVNIDVVQLWKFDTNWDNTSTGVDGGTSSQFCSTPITTGGCNTVPNPNGNSGSTVFHLLSMDTPSSTISTVGGGATAPNEDNLYHGTKMIDGPFVGQAANFNLQTIPVPAAVWLLGSGLMGLVGVARRKKK